MDFCYFADGNGKTRTLGEGAKVPAIFEGEIAKIDSDFLGESIYVKHGVTDGQGRWLWTAYGHMVPSQEAARGGMVLEGCVLGKVVEAGKKGSNLPSHLHVSVAWVPGSLGVEAVDWQVLAGPKVLLVDPLSMLRCRYRVTKPKP